jgi:Ice-binding-like/Bacterial Ig-like domain
MAVALVAMTGLSVVAQSTPAFASPPAIILVDPIDLGRAAPFGVLAGASIGNTATGPITIVRGDMGVFAATGAVTGFPPGLVRGTQYASGDTAVVDAHTDLLAAYTAAANRPSNFPLAPDLLGLTLMPGVHTSAVAVANTGTVTLDGGGQPNAVFIFQIGAAFSAAASSHVVLINGTQAKNVFWQVNGAGAVGATSDFAGTMMTAAAIGVGANSLFNGRALAETGAITTNSNQFYSGPPAITITGGATVNTADNTPTIAGTTTADIGATVTVTIGGQTLPGTVQSDGAWTVTAASLVNNPYTVTAVATDGAGNIGTATQSLTVDITPPVVTINGPSLRVTNDPTPTVDGTTDVGVGSLVTVTFDGQPMTALVQTGGTWNVTSAALAEGSVGVVATVHDLAGNPGTATQTLGIDLTAPVVTIIGGTTSMTNSATPTLTGTVTGGAAAVSIDGQNVPGVSQVGGGWTAAFPVARAPLSDGNHYIVVTATDVAGNTSAVSQTLTVDASLPTIAIVPGAVDATNDQTPTISGTTDVAAGSIVTVTINGGASMSASVQANGSWNTTPSASLAAGIYAVVATVGDTAGNIGTATQSLTVDVTAPTVTITGGASRSTGDATPAIAGSSVGAVVGTAVTVAVAGQVLSTTVGTGGAWTTTAATIANGGHAVTVTITDLAGNIGSAAQSLTISAVAPIVTITGGATASSNDSTPTIAGTSTATSGSAVVVSVSGQVLNATVQPGGSWNVTAAVIANGAVAVSVVVTDLDGNVGLATQTLTVDSTNATLVSISGGTSRLTNNATPTISGTTDAADGRVVTVIVGGQTMTTPAFLGAWSVTAAHLADGIYTVNASVSAPGNPGASAPQALTVDTVVPIVVLPGGGTIGTTDSTPTISGSNAPPGATVTVTVDGQTLTTTVAADGTWSVTPLIPLGPGPHTVVVTITDLAGNQGIGVQVITVTPPIILPPAGLPVPDYTPVGPRRVFDTRAGQSLDSLRVVAKQQVSGRYELQVQMTSLVGFVPSTGVGAVSLNVTSTGSTSDGFITVYGCGSRELVSSVNFPAGRTVANAVVAPVSANGMVCFYANSPTDIVVDINGWFATGAAFTSVGPKRVFDTRPGNSPDALRTLPKTKIPANGMIEVQLTDLEGYVPTTGANSVSLNVVVTNPDAAGFITVYSCGPRALVSNLNYVAGQTVANAVVAPVSASGTVCFYSLANVDLVVDINGWFAAGSSFTGVAPARVLDTRAGNSPDALRDVPKTKIGGNNVLEVRVTDLTGLVPANGVVAVSLNVTATNPDGNGFVTVFACGAMEQVSSLNFTLGTTVANAVLAPVSASGTICLYSNVSTDVIVDINGWLGTAQSG